MKNIVNYIIGAMEKNNYNFKVENAWDDTVTLILIDEEKVDVFYIDFNIKLEKVFIFETWRGNVELIQKYDLHDFMKVTGFIEDFYNYN